MGNETKNYKFPKPGEDDFYDISEYNKAMDILDETLTGMNDRKLDRNGNASNVVTEFSQEILRDNIVSGEKLSVSHGKIQKWFSEMKNIAFSGLASDATQDAAHRFVTDTERSNWNAKVSASGGDITGTKISSLETITSEFPVPFEGETSKMFLGKVKKFIQDFNNFKTGVITVGKLVNNGQTTAAGYALDARYGKALLDMYTQLNADLSYKVISSGDVLALDRGYYYAYPGCINLPPDMDQAFWLSVNGVDNNNKIIEAIPAGAGYKYFYKAKKINGTWQGWNKYLENSDLGYYRRIRYGVKFIVDSGGRDWIRIPLADLGFPNDTLTDYPCVIALPQININDTVNTNRDVQILCSKPNTDRRSIELLLNRAFSGGVLFSVWYII